MIPSKPIRARVLQAADTGVLMADPEYRAYQEEYLKMALVPIPWSNVSRR